MVTVACGLPFKGNLIRVTKSTDRQPGMPSYVMLSEEPVMHHHLFDAMGPGYLGVAHSPFAVLQNPYPVEFQHERLQTATSSFKRLTGSVIAGRCSLNSTACRDNSIRIRPSKDLIRLSSLHLNWSPARKPAGRSISTKKPPPRGSGSALTGGGRWHSSPADWWNRESRS